MSQDLRNGYADVCNVIELQWDGMSHGDFLQWVSRVTDGRRERKLVCQWFGFPADFNRRSSVEVPDEDGRLKALLIKRMGPTYSMSNFILGTGTEK